MDVELLVVPDCPHASSTEKALREALEDVGLAEVTFRTTVVRTQDDAELRCFVGSPTILVNGQDPFATTGRPPALACRMYPTSAGLAGIPDARQLRRALRRSSRS